MRKLRLGSLGSLVELRCGIPARRAGLLMLAAALVTATSSCGGAKDSVAAKVATEATATQIDADPFALLPSAPLAVAQIDARAFYASDSVGAQLALLSERLVPIGEEAGFVASRDVDRVVVGSYAMQGADVVAVLRGRFDEGKMAQAASNHVPNQSGSVIVASSYAGRTIYTVNNVGFVVLTKQTVLAGTETALRRALDRIRDGRVRRDLPRWVAEVVEASPSAMTLVADLGQQPVSQAAVGGVNLPWMRGLKTARVFGDFKAPGLNVSGTLGYSSADDARGASEALQHASRMVSALSMTGIAPRLRDLSIAAVDRDAQFKFSIDDEALRTFATTLPRWVR